MGACCEETDMKASWQLLSFKEKPAIWFGGRRPWGQLGDEALSACMQS